MTIMKKITHICSNLEYYLLTMMKIGIMTMMMKILSYLNALKLMENLFAKTEKLSFFIIKIVRTLKIYKLYIKIINFIKD